MGRLPVLIIPVFVHKQHQYDIHGGDSGKYKIGVSQISGKIEYHTIDSKAEGGHKPLDGEYNAVDLIKAVAPENRCRQ